MKWSGAEHHLMFSHNTKVEINQLTPSDPKSAPDPSVGVDQLEFSRKRSFPNDGFWFLSRVHTELLLPSLLLINFLQTSCWRHKQLCEAAHSANSQLSMKLKSKCENSCEWRVKSSVSCCCCADPQIHSRECVTDNKYKHSQSNSESVVNLRGCFICSEAKGSTTFLRKLFHPQIQVSVPQVVRLWGVSTLRYGRDGRRRGARDVRQKILGQVHAGVLKTMSKSKLRWQC